MTRLAELPPDQRATLSLLVTGRRTYRQVGGLLGISAQSAHDRAHAALALLAPRAARRCSESERERIGEYLLGQQDLSTQAQTVRLLEGSDDARAWASAIVHELADLDDATLPRVPSSPPAAIEPKGAVARDGRASAPDVAARSPSISRRGGAVLLGVIAAIVVVAVVLIVNSGSSESPSGHSPVASARATTTNESSTSASAAKPKFDAQLNLSSPQVGSKAVAVVEIISEGSEHAFYVVAEGLRPSDGHTYVAWLYNSPSEAVALGSGPTVSSNGRLGAIGALPSDARSYRKMIITRESTAHPTQPGPIVLEGPFRL